MTSSMPLPTAAPSDAGVDATGIRALVDALEADPTQEPHGLMVLRHGTVIAQGWWTPYTAGRPQLAYSLSKSFTAAAAGVLVADGVLDLDSIVVSHFPEFADDITDERARRMRVRHVASMASGHENEMLDAAMTADPDEPVRGFLLHAPDQEPGTVFAYNQPTTYTLAAIVQRLSGQTLVELLRDRVLGPIGAPAIAWEEWPAGRNIGYSGAYVTTETIARLGQLLLNRGTWDGQQVLSDDWIVAASSVQVATASGDEVGTSDWSRGYGFQHWMSRHGFRGDGAFGQLCLVLPEQDLVVAYQGQTIEMQRLLDAVWEHLVPAVDRPGDAEADQALAAQLAAVTLPHLAVAGVDVDAGRWDGAAFEPAPDAGDAAFAATLRRDGEAWLVALTGSTGQVEGWFTGEPGWTVTEGGGPALAVSGVFTGPDELALDVVFVETPHRLHLRLDRGAGIVRAEWQTPPLRDASDLRGLAAPRAFG